jgi:hypothetical protein
VQGKDAADLPTIDKVFDIGMHTKLVCEETGEVVEIDDTERELGCNISIEVNQLAEGIRLNLKSDREQPSAQLGRNVVFKVCGPSCTVILFRRLLQLSL